ncbi:O-antigen ligase family protein [Candidatus Magnetominusculus xianensis]|uniref:O-antigen ligase n=1 Tax=Candidatus Magnetominusculus xianensis TaxID=1748249 RepID=A0ABR5SDP8_9BACT|nr:O-antigen ligase family protein [Candidatus Magnetominusculus xianensis]KWT81191.1 O-antigen ligase [Candidatus Magnetominusculus xianensis]MBF0404295.1 O-antigen ligase family protein [Nitrospirota bacterium]
MSALASKFYIRQPLRQTPVLIIISMCCVAASVMYMINPVWLAIPAALVLLAAVFFAGYEFGFLLTIFTFYIEFTCIEYFVSETGDAAIFPICILFMTIAFGAWLYKKATDKTLKRETTPVDIVVVLILVYNGISLLWSPSLEEGSLFYLQMLFGALIYYLITAVVTTREKLHKLIVTLIVSGVICSISVFVSKWYTSFYDLLIAPNTMLSVYGIRQIMNRPTGLTIGAPSTPLQMEMIIISITLFFLTKDRLLKSLYTLIAAIGALAIVMMAVRGAFVALGAAIIMFYKFHPIHKEKFVKYTAVTLFAYLMIIITATPGFIDRLIIGFGYKGSTMFTTSKTLKSNTEELSSKNEGVTGIGSRMTMWKTGLRYMIKHPYTLITGIGVGGFVYVVPDTISEVHSLIFSFFYEMGVFGLLVLAFFVNFFARTIYQTWKEFDGSYMAHLMFALNVAAIAVFAINGLIQFDLTSHTARFVWLLLGFYLVVLRLYKQERSAATAGHC